MKNKIICLSVLAFIFAGCEPEFENELSNSSYNSGDADFSSYVAVGNSLTAGYMDGSMSRVGQSYSFPNLLAQQFAVAGGGEFTQPSYEEDVNNLGGIIGIPGYGTRLIIDASAGGPEPIAGTSTITLTQQATAYNNMGVPGAKSFHLLAAGYGNSAGVPLGLANPYYVRHATSPTATVLGDAMSKNPTFFTNWIGSNDVLAFATSGGVGVNQLGNFDPNTYGFNDITDPTVFAGVYSQITTTLTSGGAKGVVATIPDVTSIPFFTTVPHNPITASLIGGGNVAVGQAAITQLNAELYGPITQALAAFGQPDRIAPLSTSGNNPLLIVDETLTNLSAQIAGALIQAGYPAPQAQFIGSIFGQARQATSNDLILLSTRSVIGTAPAGIPAPFDAFGITYPLQDQHVLTADEADMVAEATVSFNQSIRGIAEVNNLAVADMNAILAKLVTGLRTEDGQLYNADYFSLSNISTVLFSLDGVHPNARGYAVVANEIIKIINDYYNAKLPQINAGNFPGATVLPTN
ncbi:G-D-S-L family lipolytic protein [Flavobacterium salilacus subsp. salilacus]|uniref:G-D-S-L family lipolytic protein n=1 Tax=Flavobacterium TaxID=237 RepID=UPI0010754340|nr:MULTISPECIES: G-D-S-L family lipolytic protein [Flavobacterium]KAF2518202.1 G-D-S-L family lipolytic protein [Flavobacterium salilacus subsp. salilacus]MBE1615485.1 G-D-S-L family lipolytic protein [Flavobacterium sp. SaA2.13]